MSRPTDSALREMLSSGALSCHPPEMLAMAEELLELREVKARHLATIRMLTMDEATAEDVAELRRQNAALIAEVGTLRSERAELLARIEGNGRTVTTRLDRLAEICGCPEWQYPGQVVRDVEAMAAELDATIVERDKLRAQLGAVREVVTGPMGHPPSRRHWRDILAILDGEVATQCRHCFEVAELRPCCVSDSCKVCDRCWANSEGNFHSCPTHRRRVERES